MGFFHFCCGYSCCFCGCGGLGGEVLAVVGEVEQGVAELTIHRELIAAEQFHAGDVERVRWLGGVGRYVRIFGEIARERFRGQGLPGEDEVETGVVFLEGMVFSDRVLVKGDLEGDVAVSTVTRRA